MASGPFAVACREIGRLFGPGTVAGLAECQLLDRFVARRDDAAFEAIVARHGPMVRAVCRSILRDPNDVDDAFQATFLVLVKKAETLGRRDLLGNWLYGVALRVARRARAQVSRRRERGSDVPDRPEGAGDDPDARAAIHAEVARLPTPYRSAVVLCYFEGRTHEEAARELGWPVGTVKGRLARARDLLRGRLARRGLAPTAGALLVSAADGALGSVPAPLLESTVAAAVALASGRAATVLVLSSRAFALAQGVLPAMSTTKMKLAATALVAAGVLSSTGVSAWQLGGRAAPTPDDAPTSSSPWSPPFTLAGARLKLIEEAIATHQRTEGTSKGDPDQELIEWQRRLAEARIEAGQPRDQAIRTYIIAVRQAIKEARDHRTPASGMGDLADTEFRALEAGKVLEKVQPAPNALPDQGGAGVAQGSGGGFGGTFGAREPNAGRLGGMGGGMRIADPTALARLRIVSDIETEDKYPRPRKQPPSDVERNQAIEEKLEKVVPIPFDTEVPLSEVLKYIKEKTKDAKGKEIPIYVDPIGLQEAEKTLGSTVTLEIDDVPLRTTLRLMLAQLGLGYAVRDGLLKISDVSTLKEIEDGERYWEAIERAGPGPFGPPAAAAGSQGQPAASPAAGGGFR